MGTKLNAVALGLIGLVAWSISQNPRPPKTAPEIVTPATAEEPPFELPPSTRSGWPLSENPRVAAYQRVAESIDRKVAVANVVADCGIRDMDWYNAVNRRLEEYRNGPQVYPLLMVMTSEERREAQGFDMQVTREHERFLRPNGRSDCTRIARLPFPYNDAAFDPLTE